MNCGVGLRHGLRSHIAVAVGRLATVALIGPLAWESPYAVGAAIKKGGGGGGSSRCGTVETNLTSIHENMGLIPGLRSMARILHCCGCGVGWQLEL